MQHIIEVVLRKETSVGEHVSDVLEVRRMLSFNWEPVAEGEEGSEFQKAIKDPAEFKKILGLTIMRGIESEMPGMVDAFLNALEAKS